MIVINKNMTLIHVAYIAYAMLTPALDYKPLYRICSR